MMNNEDKKRLHKEWHDDPNNWKFGVFYYNKADHRIFPPKRIWQLGWTINFAHWPAWIILTLILLLIVFSIKHS